MQPRSDAYKKAVVADVRETYVKAIVDIVSPDMQQGDVAVSAQDLDVARPEQLWDKKFQVDANYASLEPCRWLLDGETDLLPESAEDLPDWEVGSVGLELSGGDGTFSTPQFAQIAFSGVHILQACSVAFSDRVEDGVAEEFTVEIFSEGVAYVTRTVTGNHDALVPITEFKIFDPDTIRVTITRWTLPGRRARVVEIVPGVYEEWTGDQLKDFAIKQQCDPSCQTLPYGTCALVLDNSNRRFEPRNKKGVFEMLEERQGIKVAQGVVLPGGAREEKTLGMYYQHSGGWKFGENEPTIKWSLVDIIGLIANRKYIPLDGPEPATLKEWLEALAGQLGENFRHRVRVDPEYADLPVKAKRSVAEEDCGDILRWVCMATGTFPRADASTGYLAAEPVWNDGNEITLDNLVKYPAMSANEDVAAVIVDGYTVPGNSTTASKTVTSANPFASTEEQKKTVAKNILAGCGGNKFELTGRGDPAGEVGDVDVIWLDEKSATCARRIMQDLSYSGGVLRNCKSTLIRGGQNVFSYSESMEFTENGRFAVPDDVWRIRMLLVGHGGPGTPGQPGRWVNTLNQWMGEFLFPQDPTGGYGANGSSGGGGKVLDLTIDVNPGQVFEVTVDRETTFGRYSSADGQSYPRGYVDITTGKVYGGGGGPGSGGSGGQGGLPGYWYYKGVWVYDHGHVGVIPGDDSPGRWVQVEVIERYPTGPTGEVSDGLPGCAIVFWEPPEVISA